MSDYTLAVNWSGKDALSDSDSAKVISGTDFNSEFTTIRTALNSKADIASETLTGIPLAPTAATATDTTQIATTAFVQANKASPALTGTPTAPTAATSTNTTQIATTAMVQAAVDADIVTHAALRSASGTAGHAQIYTSGGDLYIVTT